MKKFIPILLAVILLGIVPTMASAATTVQQVTFKNLNGYYYTSIPGGAYTYDPASAVLSGNIKNKDGAVYVSPMTGTFTVGSTTKNINVKPAKESEAIYHEVYEYGTPGSGYYYKQEYWYSIGTVNIDGAKFIGYLQWYKYHQEYYGYTYDGQGSYLSFNGMVDGKLVNAWLNGEFPQ